MFCMDGYISVMSNNLTDQHGPKPPLPGEVARRSRDGEVAASLIQPLSQPPADSSPARGAFGVRSVGVGLCSARASDKISTSGRSGAPPLQGAKQIKITSPQKGADHQIWSAPSIYGRYSMATSCKFGTPVSGGAYQDAREVSLVWNDI